jgi:hypothetical protein
MQGKEIEMESYSIRLKYDFSIKNFLFQIDDADDADQKWAEACSSLGEVGDGCSNAPEFFKKAVAHFAKYGFERIAR